MCQAAGTPMIVPATDSAGDAVCKSATPTGWGQATSARGTPPGPALLKMIEDRINNQIAYFDSQIYGAETIPPEFKFDKNKKYSYRSPVDDGTGTSDKNLILFDLAILTLTQLPAIIHDSPVIKNIADETVEKILGPYQTFIDKQIFIAFDKERAYTAKI